MKKILILAIALVLVGASVSFAVISGSDHDMRIHLTGQSGGYTEICVYCHTPHNAMVAAPYTGLPLWNRTPVTNNYTPYANPNSTLDAPDVNSAIGPQSIGCMSCHDGTVAVDALYNDPTGTKGADNSAILNAAKKIVSGPGYLETDLSDDHPVGFTYTNESGLTALVTVQSLSTVKLYGGSEDQVECASCHNVHEPGTTAAGTAPFLKSTNLGSALCLVCHAK